MPDTSTAASSLGSRVLLPKRPIRAGSGGERIPCTVAMATPATNASIIQPSSRGVRIAVKMIRKSTTLSA